MSSSAAASKLLPRDVDEFRSRSYWQRFFEERKGKAFEWYAEAEPVVPHVLAAAKQLSASSSPSPRILVPGCGNSDLSEKLHKAGLRDVTSVDFDAGVIDSMREKTSRRCPGLVWAVGDARSMPVDAGSFAVVVDKGLLDAMLPADAGALSAPAEAERDSLAMLADCARALAPGGVHVIVTLLQDHAARLLVRWAGQGGDGMWERVDVRPLVQDGDLSSPLCPFVVTLVKRREGAPATTTTPAHVHVHLPHNARSTTPPSPTAGVDEDVLPFPLASAAGDGGDTVSPDVLAAVHRVQWQYHVARQLTNISGDTHLTLDLWPPAPAPATGIAAVRPAGDVPEGFPAGSHARYTVTVVDAGTAPASALAPPRAAVLLVPQGREHEFSFAAKEGQAALARQAGVDRLLVACMGRGHAFASVAEVQKELSPAVLTMVPDACAKGAAGIPFLAVAEDVGSRTVVAEGTSALTGDYVVEDVPRADDDDDDDDEEADDGKKKKQAGKKKETAKKSKAAAATQTRLLRRLIFMSNRNAIQSEAALVGPTPPVTPAPAAAAAAASSATASAGPSTAASIDHRALRFPYHRAMAAALACLGDAIPSSPSASSRVRVSVLGLGGGGLAMHLATRYAAWADVTAVELDPAMVDIATRYFGCATRGAPVPMAEFAAQARGAAAAPPSGEPASLTTPAVAVVVGDALEYVRILADPATPPLSRPHAIIIDIDAKDMRTGLSFPPAPFVSRAFLKSLHEALAGPKGLLLINVGARSKPLAVGVLAAVGKEFGGAGTIPTGEEEGDLNCVVVAGGDGGAVRPKDPKGMAQRLLGGAGAPAGEVAAVAKWLAAWK
jgi:SAM-dependent methyltransferase